MKAQDLFDKVTQQIIDQIESGNLPAWQKSWNGSAGGMPLNHEGKHYNGGNVIMLWISAQVNGFTNPYWITYKQAEKLGAQVKEGMKGTHVYFYSRGEKENDAGEISSFNFAKCYSVFNAQQIDNLPSKYFPVIEQKNPDQQDQATNEFIANTKATIQHVIGGGNFFAPGRDIIQLEPFDNFHHAHGYYSTALHELTHWTGSKSRLDRDQKAKNFKTEYAFEELVAELGSAFLCSSLDLASEPRADHAAYLQSWLKAFKSDKQFLFKAASHASKAANYLQGLQPNASASAAETPETTTPTPVIVPVHMPIAAKAKAPAAQFSLF